MTALKIPLQLKNVSSLRNGGRRSHSHTNKKYSLRVGRQILVGLVISLLILHVLLMRTALVNRSHELDGLIVHSEQRGATMYGCNPRLSTTTSSVAQLYSNPQTYATPRMNRKHPLVCLVMTTYNIEDYIGFALDSILNQTYSNIEIIIVDDVSTDNTFSIIQRYADEQERQRKEANAYYNNKIIRRIRPIQLGHNTNGGAGQPTNIGMTHCSSRSEYMMIMDGDDYLEPTATELFVQSAKQHDADIVMADFNSFIVNNETTAAAADDEFIFTEAYDHKDKWETLPTDVPFNILSYPVALRISPVPWRKFYKRSLLEEYNLRFPEGDYFYEDNTFHWLTLGHAARITKIDKVLFHHRQARKGQTSAVFEARDQKISPDEYWKGYSAAARSAGYFPNLYQIGQMLFDDLDITSSGGIKKLFASKTSSRQEQNNNPCSKIATPEIAKTYFEFLKASRWIAKFQKSPEMKMKFENLFVQHRDYWLDKLSPTYKASLPKTIYFDPPTNLNNTNTHNTKTMDLSIILPTYNVADLLPSLLESMYAGLGNYRSGFTFEVFAIDDGSSDTTLDILRLFANIHKDNFYLLQTSHAGAGRARNRAIPLMEGRYVYFVDADDTYDFAALADAVDIATTSKSDLLILPYEQEMVSKGSSSFQGMMGGDQRIWNKMLSRWWLGPGPQRRRREEALKLINYPWKQLTSTKLMRDADVYFGPTKVHNDVQFHWTSIAASQNLKFHNSIICTHRKFDPSVRGQLTEVKSAIRVTALDALSLTEHALERQGAFHIKEDGSSHGQSKVKRNAFGLRRHTNKYEEDLSGERIRKLYHSFGERLIKWASSRVPSEEISEYDERTKEMKHGWEPSSLRAFFGKASKRINFLTKKTKATTTAGL